MTRATRGCSNVPMDVAAVYLECYGRVPPLCQLAVEGLDREALGRQVGPGANPIGWLVWHLTRVQDHHVSELLDTEQLWIADGWAARFGREPAVMDLGYGMTADEVAAFDPVSAELLLGYHDAVDARTRAYLPTLTADDLDRVVDRSWDPPVTLGVRLVSIVDDSLQHVGQALYVRGLVDTEWRFPA
ncbi:MAG: DUF664 domain-containing protein [Acidimicrobiia bacterium]